MTNIITIMKNVLNYFLCEANKRSINLSIYMMESDIFCMLY